MEDAVELVYCLVPNIHSRPQSYRAPSSALFLFFTFFQAPAVLELADRDSQLASAVEVSAGDNGGSDEHMEKLKVVLDLDETLICAYETSSLPTALRHQATKAGLKSFELECVSPDKGNVGKPKISCITVFERPGLREFLKQLSTFADLVLFTAGLEGL